MADLILHAQPNRPSVLVVTAEGPYIVEALYATNGREIFIYHIIGPDPAANHGFPFLYADNPRCPQAYDVDSDTWDAEATFALVSVWGEG